MSFNQTNLSNQIAFAQDQAKAEADSINNWYELRRNQALMELERLETAYNERMAEHSVEWAQKLSTLMEQEMLEPAQPVCGYTENILPIPKLVRQENILPIPKLVRQQNVQYLPSSDRNFMDDLEYLNNIKSVATATEDADIPDFTNTQIEEHVIDVLAHMNAVNIVSDDEESDVEGSNDEDDYAAEMR